MKNIGPGRFNHIFPKTFFFTFNYMLILGYVISVISVLHGKGSLELEPPAGCENRKIKVLILYMGRFCRPGPKV